MSGDAVNPAFSWPSTSGKVANTFDQLLDNCSSLAPLLLHASSQSWHLFCNIVVQIVSKAIGAVEFLSFANTTDHDLKILLVWAYQSRHARNHYCGDHTGGCSRSDSGMHWLHRRRTDVGKKIAVLDHLVLAFPLFYRGIC